LQVSPVVPEGTAWHVFVPPTSHQPEQHWASPVHAVPLWRHTVEAQTLAVQVSEQHSPAFAQGSPAALQKSSVVHLPATQFAEQHWPSCVQEPFAATQGGAAQVVPLQ
jgi:hypothetical protein